MRHTTQSTAIAAMAAMAAWLSELPSNEEPCSRCGTIGEHRHMSTGQALCDACWPETAEIDWDELDRPEDDE